ncbi:5-carboxymethyl-2-hydroxymuconate isomerase [Microbaculum marinum]|uniref:5-carboxymethyl-2-hydroxymuconate isomerase n=1 Tax=Microbaculum marinum TaxID=1764581 RepID=A0AAW9RNZ0_9HYPH
MPHVIVEYSANLESDLEIQALIEALHDTALASGLFDIDGIRSRAVRRDVYRIADGNPDNGFVQITARIGEGRPAAARETLGRSLLATAEAALAGLISSTPVSLTVEVHEIDRSMTFRRNTIRERRNAEYRGEG